MQLQQACAVVPQLHVAPGERRGLRAPEQPVPQDRQQGHVHPPPPGGSLGRFLAPACAPQGAPSAGGGLHRGQGLGGQGLCLPLAARAVGPGDPLQESPDPLVVGGVLVAGGLVNCRQGGLVDPHGGHRQLALLGQVGEVGGHQGRRRRQAQDGPGCCPVLEGGPDGAVHGPGVGGDAVVQEVLDSLEVLPRSGPGRRVRWPGRTLSMFMQPPPRHLPPTRDPPTGPARGGRWRAVVRKYSSPWIRWTLSARRSSSSGVRSVAPSVSQLAEDQLGLEEDISPGLGGHFSLLSWKSNMSYKGHYRTCYPGPFKG